LSTNDLQRFLHILRNNTLSSKILKKVVKKKIEKK
jgi:hypothetical protein